MLWQAQSRQRCEGLSLRPSQHLLLRVTSVTASSPRPTGPWNRRLQAITWVCPVQAALGPAPSKPPVVRPARSPRAASSEDPAGQGLLAGLPRDSGEHWVPSAPAGSRGPSPCTMGPSQAFTGTPGERLDPLGSPPPLERKF